MSTDAPFKSHDSRLAEPDLTDEQVRTWISACNHEPARRLLRTYLMMKGAGFDVDGVAKTRMENLRLRKTLHEAEELADDLADITSNGGPNTAMRVLTIIHDAAISSDERPKG